MGRNKIQCFPYTYTHAQTPEKAKTKPKKSQDRLNNYETKILISLQDEDIDIQCVGKTLIFLKKTKK